MQPNRAVLSAAFLISLSGAARSATEGITPVAAVADLSADTGLRIAGGSQYDSAGCSVASIGDINGDGLGDLLIGAYYALSEGGYRGAAFVVFGHATPDPFPASVNLGSLGEEDGFRLNGVADFDLAGTEVAPAGDMNDDGINDFAISARLADPNAVEDAGETYIIFGRRADNPFPQIVELSDLDASEGVRVQGFQTEQRSGDAIAGGFDINGDKIDDLVIGAPLTDLKGQDDVGETYVIFGRRSTNPFPATLSLDALDGTNGFRISDERQYDGGGAAVAIASDVNGDKLPDIIIGAPGFDLKGTGGVGAVHVVYGRKASNPFPPLVELQSLNAAVDGFRIIGHLADSNMGSSLATGDINGDKIADIIFGAPFANVEAITDAGVTFVVFGRKKNNPFPTALSTGDLEVTDGFRAEGLAEDDLAGSAVAALGDLNADKVNDFVIGAPTADALSGHAYVVFGRKGTPFPESIDLSTLDGSNGFRFEGDTGTVMAASLAPAGDVNGDGRPDLIIGAPRTSADPNNLTGEAIVLYAPAPEVTVTFDAADVSSNATVELPPVEVGSPISLDVTITNTGFARLTLQNVKGPRGFVVTTPAAATLEAFDATMPQFTLTPTRPGDFSGKLTFKTNDRNEKKFTLNVLWSVNPAPLLASRALAAPRIDVDAVPDLNNDWIISAADVALMLRALNTADLSADLNHDDRVNADDLAILLSNYDRSID